jgi:hypothetical protein
MRILPRSPPTVSNRATAHFCLNCRSHKTLAGHRAHADRRSQLFIPGQPLFIPGQPLFIYDNRLFIRGSLLGREQQPTSGGQIRGKAAPSVLFDNQRHFRTRSHTVASQLHILGPHLVLFEDRIARLVDGEQVWIDGVTLGVAHALRLLETNPHKASSPGRLTEHARSDLTNRWVDRSVAKV